MNSSFLNETVTEIELTIIHGKRERQFAGELSHEDFRFIGDEFYLLF